MLCLGEVELFCLPLSHARQGTRELFPFVLCGSTSHSLPKILGQCQRSPIPIVRVRFGHGIQWQTSVFACLHSCWFDGAVFRCTPDYGEEKAPCYITVQRSSHVELISCC